MPSSGTIACGGGVAAFAALLTTILVSISDQTVPFENNAIITSIGGTIKSAVGPGRHWYGIGCDTIMFDRFDTTVEFTESKATQILVRVNDGQPIELDISFQYGIPLESLVEIYEQHKTTFHHTLEYAAKGILRDVAATWNADDFFSKRTDIEAQMRTALEEEGDERGITINGFQVRNIGLPAQLNARMVEIKMKDLEADAKRQELALDKIKAEGANLQVTLEAERNKNLTEFRQETIVRETIELQAKRLVEEMTKQKLTKINEGGSRNISLYNRETELQVEKVELDVEIARQETKRLTDEVRVTGETNMSIYNQETDNLKLNYSHQVMIKEEEVKEAVAKISAKAAKTVAEFRAELSEKKADAEAAAKIKIAGVKRENRKKLLESRFKAYDGLDGSVFLAEEIAAATLGDVKYMDVKTDDMVDMALGFSAESQYTQAANDDGSGTEVDTGGG